MTMERGPRLKKKQTKARRVSKLDCKNKSKKPFEKALEIPFRKDWGKCQSIWNLLLNIDLIPKLIMVWGTESILTNFVFFEFLFGAWCTYEIHFLCYFYILDRGCIVVLELFSFSGKIKIEIYRMNRISQKVWRRPQKFWPIEDTWYECISRNELRERNEEHIELIMICSQACLKKKETNKQKVNIKESLSSSQSFSLCLYLFGFLSFFFE